MNKKLIVLAAMVMLGAGYVFADGMAAPEAPMAMDKPASMEVGNTICPLTGRTLNLNDANDYTKLEVEGMVFNVCPKGKAAYDKDAAQFADKLAKAVTDAKAGHMAMPAADAMPAAEEAVPAAADSAAPAAAESGSKY